MLLGISPELFCFFEGGRFLLTLLVYGVPRGHRQQGFSTVIRLGGFLLRDLDPHFGSGTRRST